MLVRERSRTLVEFLIVTIVVWLIHHFLNAPAAVVGLFILCLIWTQLHATTKQLFSKWSQFLLGKERWTMSFAIVTVSGAVIGAVLFGGAWIYSVSKLAGEMPVVPAAHTSNVTQQSQGEIAKGTHSGPSADNIAAEIQKLTLSAVTTIGVLTPDNQADPQITISPESISGELKRLGISPAEMEKAVADNVARIPAGALKIYLGSNIGYTTESSTVVIEAAGKDLLTVHRSPDGILVDAQLFTGDGKIIVDIDKNEFHVNDRNRN